MTSQPQGKILFEGCRDFGEPYRLGEDTRLLQDAFLQLFDEAAKAVFLAGGDLDEVLIERLLIVRTGDQEREVPAEFLADAEALKNGVLAYLEHNLEERWPTSEIRAIKVRARHDALGQTFLR
jgi:hypothetical protein